MISIIIPFYNEAESLPILIKCIFEISNKVKEPLEIIAVDDGSTDNALSKFKINPPAGGEKLKIIGHRKRMGKGAALLSGFNVSTGDKIIFMDADLQDDPQEIPKFIAKINEGYDFVNGWRENRLDPLAKTLPSSIFNKLMLTLLFHSKYHDINCGYKAMSRSVLEEIILYGDNYRFLPIMADESGFRTTEIPVIHHPRKYGKSKYNVIRLLFGMLDTVTTYFIYRFSEKPLHFFGPIGLILFMTGLAITGYLIFQRIFFNQLLYRRPLLLIGILFVIVGIQIIMTGIIGELIVYLNKKTK